jgi:NADPH:quinone reductase-like Zn-dependent oxidoreductase
MRLADRILMYEDTPQPQEGPDEVLIQIQAVGVNPSDWKLREGQFGTQFKLPLIPGFDAAGIIQATGENVRAFRPGDAIMAYLSPFQYSSYAEYAVAKPVRFALKPASLDMVMASAFPTAAMIARKPLFDVAGLSAGVEARVVQAMARYLPYRSPKGPKIS